MAARPLPSAATASNAPILMVGLIAAIIFSVETGIMLVLERLPWQLPPYATELLDSTLLTLIASPLIFYGVTRPFAISARQAHAQLHDQLEQTQQLLQQNERLRVSLQEASATKAEIHERILQKVGGELHDGPAQVLTFALLQLDRFEPLFHAPGMAEDKAEFDKLYTVLSEALREIRGISMGLSLPELGDSTLRETIDLAVRRHRELKRSSVQVSLDGLPPQLDATLAHRVCVYRVVQEALSNACRHGNSTRQEVSAQSDASTLLVSVRDDGKGFDVHDTQGHGLGLLGMRARVQSLGGVLNVDSRPGAGTTVTARFNISSERPDDLQTGLH